MHLKDIVFLVRDLMSRPQKNFTVSPVNAHDSDSRIEKVSSALAVCHSESQFTRKAYV